MMRVLVLMVMVILLSGCGTSFHVIPSVTPGQQSDLVLVGPVSYSNNPDYLPRIVRKSDTEPGGVNFKYEYNVGYGKDAVPELLPLFNPLSIVGFPIGADSLVVVGNLEVLQNDTVVKAYSSTCVIEKTRSLFYQGKTHSELRREGLIAVRDNIENQMLHDREMLQSLVR